MKHEKTQAQVFVIGFLGSFVSDVCLRNDATSVIQGFVIHSWDLSAGSIRFAFGLLSGCLSLIFGAFLRHLLVGCILPLERRRRKLDVVKIIVISV